MNTSLQKIAITGATGHVGNVLCRELLTRGAKVKALVYQDEGILNKLGVEVVKGDLLKEASLDELCRDVDVVFHLAAKISIERKDEQDVNLVNVHGTANLIEAFKRSGVKKLIHFSSIHVLDPFPHEVEITEKSDFNLKSTMSYEVSKLMGEKLVHQAISSGLDAVIVLPTAIIGPWDYKPSLFGSAMIRMYNNSLPMLLPYGYDLVDVRDVVNGAIQAAEIGRSGERFILSGQYVNLKDLSATIGRITNRKTTSFVGSMALAYIGLPFITAWSRLRKEAPLYTKDSLDVLRQSSKNISSAKARKELGYQTRPIEDTIRDTFVWYKEHGFIK